MKASKVYVGTNGNTLALTSGKGVAVYPVQKGGKESYVLMESGKIVQLKGARINGVGVARFLSENGFELAQPGDPRAAVLADYLDMREGQKLVEDATVTVAGALQRRLAGKTCTFVPFDGAKPVQAVEIGEYRGCTSVMFDLISGFSAGVVNLKYVPGSGMLDASLAAGWLAEPGTDVEAFPRGTEYGGVIEQAVYTICNSGIGNLCWAKNLEMDEASPLHETFPRGALEFQLANGDLVQAGADGVDELLVRYLRNGELVYSRTGMPRPRLGETVGAIAAVIVRVGELDALAAKKAPKKKAA